MSVNTFITVQTCMLLDMTFLRRRLFYAHLLTLDFNSAISQHLIAKYNNIYSSKFKLPVKNKNGDITKTKQTI